MKTLLISLLLLCSLGARCGEFTFCVVADPHLDYNTDTVALRKIMQSIAADKPAFIVDLGDTFMSEKYGKDYRDSEWQYRAVKELYALTGAPVYFVIGNHDGAYPDKNPELNRWAMAMRERYFRGSSQTYYSFIHGDAEIFVLDPYKFTPRTAGRNPDDRTLGREQLRWLEKALSASSAKYKFVFTHSLVGGADLQGRDRGGAEVATEYEWGAKIHPMLKKYGVRAVFHGHDHIFVRQELDGIIYQCCPQPAALERGRREGADNQARKIASEYGYVTGEVLGGSGYLRITVGEGEPKITFVTLGTEK